MTNVAAICGFVTAPSIASLGSKPRCPTFYQMADKKEETQ